MRSRVQWLFQELPGLVQGGVLPAEAAERVREHYRSQAGGEGRRRLLLLLFGVLGAALIGSGISLLVGHNWDQLPRLARAGISVGLLLGAQGLAGWVVWRRGESVAWREGTGTFLTLAIGSCIALISQTYHMGGTLEEFLVLWAVLSLPVIYLLNVRLPAALYWVLICSATLVDWHPGLATDWFLLLAAAMVPYLWRIRRECARESRATLVYWTAAIALPLGATIALVHADGHWLWPLQYAGLFAGMYALGEWMSRPGVSAVRNPLRVVGAAGVLGLGLVLSFSEVWSHVHWDD